MRKGVAIATSLVPGNLKLPCGLSVLSRHIAAVDWNKKLAGALITQPECDILFLVFQSHLLVHKYGLLFHLMTLKLEECPVFDEQFSRRQTCRVRLDFQ